MITSKLTSKAQTTIPRPVRQALRVGEGDELAYMIERGRVILTKSERVPGDNPFATFGEWDSENDRQAYAELSISVKEVLKTVVQNLDKFVSWPRRAVLLWRGCDRVPPQGQRTKHHKYPAPIRELARKNLVALDGRSNGPAVVAFLLAGGIRPDRFVGSEAWSIHHLYSGTFPFAGREATLHAIKEGCHFTQSAGLVAAHPIADALCDEFPFFAWRLRAEAFKRFGYDPDKIFGERHDPLGFVRGRKCKVIYDRGITLNSIKSRVALPG